MTKLLDQAVDVVRRLDPADQDEIAQAIMALAGGGEEHVAAVPLTADERAAIVRSKAAAERGEFASSEQVQAVWAKYSL